MVMLSGFLSSKAKLRADAEQLAGHLPALLLKAEQIAATINVGQHGRRRVGTGEDFWQFKSYSTGDERSQIDWRQSAKRGEMFIRQKELESSENAWFWVSESPTMQFKTEASNFSKLEYAKLITLALCVLLNKADENVGILGKMEKAAHGSAHLETLTDALLADDITDTQEALKASSASAKSKIILFSDFLQPIDELQMQISQMAANKSKGAFIHIADPAEVTLPYTGRVSFLNMQGEPAVDFKRVENIKEDYLEAFKAHQNALIALAKKFDWRYKFLTTEQSPASALGNVFHILTEGG